MTAVIASSPWPAPARARGAQSWRFAREVDGMLQWVLRRNCALTPRQLLGAYLAACALSLIIALAFWWHGAPVVMLFTGAELLALGVAVLVFARHASDRETITLAGRRLAIEHHYGQAVRRADFRVEWVRVEPTAGEGSLVELSGDGRSVQVGRYLRAAQRAELATEIRRALRYGARA